MVKASSPVPASVLCKFNWSFHPLAARLGILPVGQYCKFVRYIETIDNYIFVTSSISLLYTVIYLSEESHIR